MAEPAVTAALDLDDVQGLVVSCFRDMSHAVYVLVGLGDDPVRATAWLRAVTPRVSPGRREGRHPDERIQLGLTATGLTALGAPQVTIDGLPQELVDGMPARARVLGDPVDGDGDLIDAPPDKIVVNGNLTIPANAVVSFDSLLFRGRITVATNPAHDVRLLLSRCAVARLRLELPGETPSVKATDCLFGEIVSQSGFAELVYCTVLGETHLERLWASDCIFAGDLVDVVCGGEETCVRYSRIPDFAALAGCAAEKSPHLTTDDPNFVSLYFQDGDDCVLRPADFGEPGCGVLDLTSSRRITAGAEDGGEMGAGHHLHHIAKLEAVRRKLADFLPLGQEIAIRYDPHLSRPAAAVA